MAAPHPAAPPLAAPHGTLLLHAAAFDPVELRPERWRLADGRQACLRPVQPQDLALERAFVASGLGERSRWLRFQTGLRELSTEAAQYLTAVDHWQHVALVLELDDTDGPRQIADARYVRDADAAGTAEFALAIADAWQGQGLGRRLLLRLLQHAQAHGLQALYGDVLRDNAPMLALAEAQGFRRERHPDDARLLRLRRTLVDAAAPRSWTAGRWPERGTASGWPGRPASGVHTLQ